MAHASSSRRDQPIQPASLSPAGVPLGRISQASGRTGTKSLCEMLDTPQRVRAASTTKYAVCPQTTGAITCAARTCLQDLERVIRTGDRVITRKLLKKWHRWIGNAILRTIVLAIGTYPAPLSESDHPQLKPRRASVGLHWDRFL